MSEKSISIQTEERSTPVKTSAGIRLVEPQNMQERIQQTFSSIARRAFEVVREQRLNRWQSPRSLVQGRIEFLHPVHVQLAETTNALLLTFKLEVPGFSANELQVSLDSRQITISGKKESSKDHKSGETIYSEQCCSEILRVIALPAEIDVSKTTATLKNGILEIALPKATEAKNTKGQAQAASAAR